MEQSPITQLLERLNQGDRQAGEELVGSIYAELRRLAGALMRRERPGHTLQPTALVHEAFLRLVQGDTKWQNRAHFFGAAARAMRRILVDHARGRAAQKRAGGEVRVTFEDLAMAAPDPKLDLRALEAEDPRLAKVVELRYFLEETAALLEVSVATVKRDWLYARAWLYAFLEAGTGPGL